LLRCHQLTSEAADSVVVKRLVMRSPDGCTAVINGDALSTIIYQNKGA
jgi:hypothetical protein